MLRNFFNRFEAFVNKHELITQGDRVLIGVSGGIDSVVLLDLLMELKGRTRIEVAVAHINHRLRGEESEGDEKFVRELADAYSAECFVQGAETREYVIEHRTSLQVGAREIRYKFFDTVRILKNFTKIATAHNANDNAETVFFNLLRGSGANGLGGIPIKRGEVIRPLLFAQRDEISQYARVKSLKYREDSSNTKNYYTRNYIRHSLLPEIKDKINPGIVSTLNRSAEIFQELEAFIRDEAKSIYKNVARILDDNKLVLDISKLRSCLLFLQERIIIDSLRSFVHGEIQFSKVHAIMNLIDSETGSSIEIGNNITVYRDRQSLVFVRGPVDQTEFVAEIVPGRKYEFEDFYFDSEEVSSDQVHFPLSPVVEFVNAERAGKALTLRQWHPGDWFVPLGMAGRKKISDFLVDRKMPIYQKKNVLVLTNRDNVIWVCGLRLDDRFKITGDTRSILKIEFGYK